MGQNCHITCGNKVFIDEGVSIMPDVLITDIEHQYIPGKTLGETGLQIGSVFIGKKTVIGKGACILGSGGIHIGDNVVIGSNAVVKKDIEDYSIVAGIPAKVIRKNYNGN